MEYVDLVDENDRIVRPSVPMDEAYRQKEWFLRWANLFIQNSEGKLWIPRRHPKKTTFPNGLDFSAGGHVSAGETYVQAIVRETLEEIGLPLEIEKLRMAHRTVSAPPVSENDIAFISLTFLYPYDGPIEFNPSDISEAWWMEPKTVIDRLSDPNEPETKSGLLKILKALFENR